MSVIEYKSMAKSNMKNMNHSYIREIFIEKYLWMLMQQKLAAVEGEAEFLRDVFFV